MPNKEQTYSLNCERCDAVYQSTEGFPEPPLCPKCLLVEKCLLSDKKIQCLGIEYEEGDHKYTLNEYLQREQLIHAIPIIAQEIKNMKLLDTLPEKPLSGYEMMFRRKHDIRVQREYGRAVLKAIHNLLSGENT